MNKKISETNIMQAKDYITCGIFSALCIVGMLIAAIMNISGYTTVFYCAVAAFFIGILYAVLLTKVPKRGAVLVFGIIPCLYLFLSGVKEGMIGVAFIIAFSIISEAILWNHHNSIRHITVSGVVYTGYLSFGSAIENFVMADSYCDNALAAGINKVLVEQMRMMFHMKWLCAVVMVLTVVLTLAGIMVGRKIMKKHLRKAGIL